MRKKLILVALSGVSLGLSSLAMATPVSVRRGAILRRRR